MSAGNGAPGRYENAAKRRRICTERGFCGALIRPATLFTEQLSKKRQRATRGDIAAHAVSGVRSGSLVQDGFWVALASWGGGSMRFAEGGVPACVRLFLKLFVGLSYVLAWLQGLKGVDVSVQSAWWGS